MAALDGLKPRAVFEYFEALCAIPHGSGNTKRISDYCAGFAREHGLRCIRDGSGNVIILKDGTKGYEHAEPVLFQGHLDMVCEKTADCPLDLEKDGLTLRLDGDAISAEGTTLGGDDGIAVAYGLALLAAGDIPHPPLEVVFTTGEEIGMLGAAALDCSPLRARTMLNVDSEEEGILLVSCAGGSCVSCRLPVRRQKAAGVQVTLTVGGLAGGHSGLEIDKGRANADQLLGRALCELGKELSYALIDVSGGLKDNAIPREAAAHLVVEAGAVDRVRAFAERYQEIFAAQFRAAEPTLSLTAEAGEAGEVSAMSESAKTAVIAALVNLPGGIQRMSAHIPGLVQTSLNMGTLSTSDSEVTISFAVRSSVDAEKEELCSQIAGLIESLGGTVDRTGNYPAWEYKPDSRLRALMVEVFTEQYGHAPELRAVHAGVECGLFAGKLPGLDCVSFGPDIFDIHTTSEHLSVASVQRTWAYILEVLRRLK